MRDIAFRICSKRQANRSPVCNSYPGILGIFFFVFPKLVLARLYNYQSDWRFISSDMGQRDSALSVALVHLTKSSVPLV